MVLSCRIEEYQPVKDGYNELYSQNSPVTNERHYFLALFVRVWSYLRITARARLGIMSYIVKSPSVQISGIFVGVFSGRI